MLRKTVFEIVLLIVVSVCILTMAFNIQSVTASLSVTISPSSPVVARNSTFKFTANVAGGTPPYQYRWNLRDVENVPLATGTGNPWNCTVPRWAYVGIGKVYVEVHDSLGGFVSTSEDVLIVVISVSVSPASVSLDVGQSQVFNLIVLGGTAPFSYQWYLDGSLLAGATSASWTYTPSSAGSHTVCSKVKDATSVTGISVALVNVNVAPSVSISPTLVSLDVGLSRLFTSTATGGASPFSYQWYLDGSPVSGATSSSWTYTPSSASLHSVYVRFTDNASIPVAAQSNTASVTVNTAPSVIITPTTVVMDVGQSQLFSSGVSGGASPYSYQWYLNRSAVFGATSDSWAFTPVSAGSYTVFLNVTDSLGLKVESNIANVTVNSQLVAPTVTAKPAAVDQGQSATLTNSTVISTGTSPYAYQWLEKAPSDNSYSLISGATSFNYTFSTTTSTETGLWSFVLRVTDATGATVNSTTTTATVYFSVTFARVGLPQDTLWNATFNGVTKSSNASQIVFTAIAAGSYSWRIGTPIPGGIGIRYAASPQSGLMNVSTQTVQSITFTNQYYLMVGTSPLGVSSPIGQGWYDSDANVTVSTKQYVNTTSGSRYRFGSWMGASGDYSSAWVVMSSAKTVTANYVVQYKLTLTSGHDSPNPSVGDHWYDAGTHIDASVTSPADQFGGTRYRCTGHTGSGSISSDSETSVGFNITAPSSLTWTWIVQYKLTMASNFGTTSPSLGDHWYDAGSIVSIRAISPRPSPRNGEFYFWFNWTGSGSGSYSGRLGEPSVTMNGPITETAFWIHQSRESFDVSPSRAETATSLGTNVLEATGAPLISATPRSGYTFSSWSTTGPIMVKDASSSSTTASSAPVLLRSSNFL